MPRNPPKPKPSNLGQLRIIAGRWRGRKLQFPALAGLRPTGDRIRETLFNWLQNDLVDAHCLDLFAGSGALGLEALSRGAAHCTFIDSQADACRAMQANLDLLHCQQGRVVHSNALAWLKQTPDPSQTRPYQIVFCDPPFQLGLWAETLALLAEHPQIAEDAWVYVEAPRSYAIDAPLNWHLHRSKETGQVRFCLFRVTA